MDLGMEIPLRHLNPTLQMALGIFGNRREAAGPLAYNKRRFWTIMLVFVDRNDAVKAGLSLSVAMHILVCLFCCITQSQASKLTLKAQIYKSFPTPPHWCQENAAFQVEIGN